LRVGHAERSRLAAIRDALDKKPLLPLADLLVTGPRDFRFAYDSGKGGSGRAFLPAWALAHYLNFERRLLGTKALDAHVAVLAREADPASAFR